MKYRLGDLAQIKYGKDHKKLNKGSIPVYGTGGMMRRGDNYLFDGESVLIPRKGSLNNVMYVKEKFWTVDTMFWTRVNTDIVLPKYLYYYLSKIDLESLNVGSAVPSLTTKILNELILDIPELGFQREVIRKIEPIEKKVTLNNQINDNLLELANIIFTNRITKETVQLSNIATIQNGYAFKSKEYVLQKQLLILRTKNIGDNHLFNKSDVVFINQDSFNEYKKFAFKQFDTVLVMVGASIGKTGFITSNVLPSLQNQNMWRFRAKDSNIPGLLIYEYVNYINKRVKGSASGSARSFYRKKLFSDFEVPIIDNNVFTLFERIQLQINNIQVENNILSKLKQELLNKYF